jgi:hypothetical protein
LFGQFTDAGAVAQGLKTHSSHVLGALFAIVLLDASLVGANAVSLATTYTLGDTFHRRHSLHWKISEAKLFYAGYAVLIGIAATIMLSSNAHMQGLITQWVQALAGVLLPSATVFLVLLCNDKPVLGPWVNTVRQNIVAGAIVWTLVLLSLALTASTFFQNLTAGDYELGFAIGIAIGAFGGVAIGLSSRRASRRAAADAVVAAFDGIDTEQVEELAVHTPLTRAERRALRDADRTVWRTPALDSLERPVFSPLRKAGLLTLRGYLLIAVALVCYAVFHGSN